MSIVDTSPASVDATGKSLREHLSLADRCLAVSIYLALKLQRLLFLEDEAGVWKTEVAKVLTSTLGTDLIRLQCYEGIDASHAVHESNYARQLLEIQLREAAGDGNSDTSAEELFSDRFLIKRPLLQAIDNSRERPPVRPAHRRVRPGRRRVRGFPAGTTIGLSGNDPRAGYSPRRATTHCGNNIKPYARGERRTQTPLLVLLD